MVNASLNWASIVGIVLAVCGGGLYFLRSFKPALARDYDVFFAAIGLLCGGILFFQGWRLDPILQFGQFLLAGTTVFFAYESVRLRGIATDQARRSSFFEDDQVPNMPRNSSRNRWEEDYEQFDEPDRPSRRFRAQDIDQEDGDFGEERTRSRRVSRAIPESAVSRRRSNDISENEYNREFSQRRRFKADEDQGSRRNNFGDRRSIRNEVKRGSRPTPNKNASIQAPEDSLPDLSSSTSKTPRVRGNIRTQTLKNKVEDASFTQKNSNLNQSKQVRRTANNPKSNNRNQAGRYNVGSKKDKPRDNSSRFDD